MKCAKEMANEVAQLFINGNDAQKQAILSCFDEDEKRVFLLGVGAIRLFNDQKYFNAVRDAVCERVYNDLQQRSAK